MALTIQNSLPETILTVNNFEAIFLWKTILQTGKNCTHYNKTNTFPILHTESKIKIYIGHIFVDKKIANGTILCTYSKYIFTIWLPPSNMLFWLFTAQFELTINSVFKHLFFSFSHVIVISFIYDIYIYKQKTGI